MLLTVEIEFPICDRIPHGHVAPIYAALLHFAVRRNSSARPFSGILPALSHPKQDNLPVSFIVITYDAMNQLVKLAIYDTLQIVNVYDILHQLVNTSLSYHAISLPILRTPFRARHLCRKQESMTYIDFCVPGLFPRTLIHQRPCTRDV
ncbi:hypothetical protein H0H93_014565 [Arthromyces matolae]|nr:hypothetical protein H0H93_014565 [Arthromyces matolae]